MIGGTCGSDYGNPCQADSANAGKNALISKAGQASAKNKQNQAHENGSAGNTGTPAGNTGTPAGHIDHFGGAGSAWRSSVYSRGPVNYPNNGWEKGNIEFNQFSKTGTYIKNTDLPYAVAPISTGAIKDNSPVQGTVSDFVSNYAAYGAGKKKSIKKKSVKKKSLTKKNKSIKKKSIKKKSIKKKSIQKKSVKKKSTKKKTTLTVCSDKLGWRPYVRTQNLNKLLIKAHKMGMKKVIVDNWPDKDDVYVVQKEILKRKL